MNKNIDECRACGAPAAELTKYFDFGDMPLANNLELTKAAAINAERFPMSLYYCPACSLSQIGVVIDPAKLFSHYVYRSSMSQTYKDHCRRMAETLRARFGFTDKSFCIDIAGNDGTLLFEFRQVFGYVPCVNFDPARNLCNLSADIGVPARSEFWGADTARKFVETERAINRHPEADIITATNVFAHVDDVQDFIAGVKIALKTKGVFVVEFPHVVDFLNRAEFDTVYFEHLSYFGLTSFVHTLKASGLIVFDCEKFDIHGGTLRLYVCHAGDYGVSTRVLAMRIEEERVRENEIYTEFSRKAKAKIEVVKNKIRNATKENKTVAAFAASAKGNTFLNCLGSVAHDIAYIVDETPEKIGKYSPGVGLEIVGPEILFTSPPDLIILLAWNFREEIVAKLKRFGYTGEIFCPE